MTACLWGSSQHGVVQEVPTCFCAEGNWALFHFYFPLSWCDHHIATAGFARDQTCLLLQVVFWHRPSWLLPRKSLPTVWGNLGKKNRRGSWKMGRLILLLCIRTTATYDTQKLYLLLLLNSYLPPTWAAYIHPMSWRNYHFSVPHKTTERWDVLHE